jgi:DNA-binding response OmpR family regulator
MARILVVDDDPAILNLVSATLGRRGHQVETAPDARAGLVMASSNFDLVVTDVMMPLIDGWDFVRLLRSWTDTALIPVVFLTALDSETDRMKGFRLGADDYVAKPFRPPDLADRIERILERSKGMRQSCREQFRDAGPAIKGSLSQMGIATVLNLLDMEKSSGELVLHRGGETARLVLKKGRIASAVLEREGGPRGPDCVYALLQWADGSFGFFAKDTGAERDAIGRSTPSLLMEAARRMDEAARDS